MTADPQQTSFAQKFAGLLGVMARGRTEFLRIRGALDARNGEPPAYDLVAWLFQRGMGFIFLCAFASFGVQAMGLIGSEGILPLASYLGHVKEHLGAARFVVMPSVFWVDAGDTTILGVCWTGAGLAVLMMADLLPAVGVFALYALYLSLFYAGQVFMGYQWDTFVLEMGFLSFLLTLSPRPVIWLLRWLMFRFMFLSGTVKWASDDAWRDLTALTYHFHTQPLPSPVAWYADHLPLHALMFATFMTFVVELPLPFLIFLSRRLRMIAAGGFLMLESLISLTGSYNFFNLQTMLLCLPLFDDAALRRVIPARALPWLEKRAARQPPGKIARRTVAVFAAVIVFTSLVQMEVRFGGEPSTVAEWAIGLTGPPRIVSPYGLFAVMTRTRPEIVIEGSGDGQTWKEYGFRYKPGDVMRAPSWNIPHQPRLDWQLWFAALEPPGQNGWLVNCLSRLLDNDPAVLALFARNPFPDKPPAYVRALVYDYRFTTAEERAKTGAWWKRTLTGVYIPAIRLK